MKKLFAVFLAAALVLAIAPVALALPFTDGDIVLKDDEYYDDVVTSVTPGSKFWVYLEDGYDGSGVKIKEPKSIKIDEVTVTDSDTGKEVKMLSVSKTPSWLRYGSDSKDRAYFAEVTVKSVSASSYPEDGFDVTEFVLTYTSYASGSGVPETPVYVDDFTIAYEEADDEFDEDPKMFSFEKDDDVDIDLPGSAGTFTGVARRDFDVVAAMDTDPITSLLNKYPSADLQFFNGSGASFPVSSGKLTFEADNGDYLYEVGANNTLTDRSNTWSSSKKAFVVPTTVIGKYIISDTKLSATAAAGGTSSSSSSSQSEYIGTTPPPVVISNPQTGAAV